MNWVCRDADEFSYYNLIIDIKKPKKKDHYFNSTKQWYFNNSFVFSEEEWKNMNGPELVLGEGPVLIRVNIERK